MTSLPINDSDWPIRYLEGELAARAAAGTFDIEKDLHLPADTPSSEEPGKHTQELCAYEAHVLAAAAGHRKLAEEIWMKASLGQVIWQTSELEGYPDRICPICFDLANLGSNFTDCPNHHQVFCRASDVGHFEKKAFHGHDGEIELGIFHQFFEESSNLDEVREVLFSDDPIGRCLKAIADETDWLNILETGNQLRVHTEQCDIDMWGDTGKWFYHPDPVAFIGKVEEMLNKMEERCLECGLDAAVDYFG